MSTLLQRQLFSNHPEIYYGGIGIHSNIDFRNDDLNLICESAIPYYREIRFRKDINKFHEAIQSFVNEAKRNESKYWCLSSEHLLFNFTPQTTDISTKLDRIRLLFPSSPKVVLVIREQFGLIRSLFKEYVRMGCTMSFFEFFEWIYKYQDRNFFDELIYSDVITLIKDKLPSSEITVLFIEDYLSNVEHLFKDLQNRLSLTEMAIKQEIINPSLADNIIPSLIEANKKHPFDFSATILEGIENHRRRVFLTKIIKLSHLSEKEIFDSVIKKRQNIHLAENEPLSEENFYKVSSTTFSRLSKLYKKDWKILSDLLGKNINGLLEPISLQLTDQWIKL